MKLASGIAFVLCVAACGDSKSGDSKSAKDKYVEGTKRTEADLNLNAIGKAAKAHYAEMAAFPDGKAGPTPPGSCCAGPDHKCPVDQAQWLGGAWEKLDFEMVEPHRFQYSYEGTADKFTARAVGDLDCDGTTIEYVLEGRVENGSPVINVTAPAGAD